MLDNMFDGCRVYYQVLEEKKIFNINSMRKEVLSLEKYLFLKAFEDKIKSEKIRELRGQFKKTYRLVAIAIFGDIIYGNFDDAQKKFKLFNAFKDMSDDNIQRRNGVIDKINNSNTKDIKEINESFLFRITEKNIHEVISFIRNYLKDFFNHNKVMYQYKDLDFFISGFHYFRGIEVYKFNWIDLSPFNSNPVITVPDYYAYQDMINVWNMCLEKEKKFNEVCNSTVIVNIENDVKISDLPTHIRSIYFEYNTLRRYSLISGATFVEAYLFYLFFVLKEKNEFSENKLLRRNDVRRITDIQIYEGIIEKEFPDRPETIDCHFEKYKETLKYRDRLVHLSAFQEPENSNSQLEVLLKLDIELISKHLQNALDFVIAIDDLLDIKLLFWISSFEKPSFKDFRKIKNTKIDTV